MGQLAGPDNAEALPATIDRLPAPFWAADPKGTMSYRTEGGISVRLNVRANERTNVVRI